MAKKAKYKDNIPKGFNPMSWIAGALFVLGIGVLAGLYWEKTVVVKEIRFGVSHFVTSEQLDEQVDIPTGISPDSLNFIRIIKKIETIPYVKRAAVSVEPSGDLLIEVTERQPIALLANGKDKIYVDEDGIRLPIIPGKAMDVPILYGFEALPMDDTLRSAGWQQTCDFLMEMRRDPVGNATISEVAWTENEGIIAISHRDGVRLVFGKEEFKKRLRNWNAFYSEIIREKGIKKMQSVDLRFEGQIVTRES